MCLIGILMSGLGASKSADFCWKLRQEPMKLRWFWFWDSLDSEELFFSSLSYPWVSVMIDRSRAVFVWSAISVRAMSVLPIWRDALYLQLPWYPVGPGWKGPGVAAMSHANLPQSPALFPWKFACGGLHKICLSENRVCIPQDGKLNGNWTMMINLWPWHAHTHTGNKRSLDWICHVMKPKHVQSCSFIFCQSNRI